MDSLDILLWKVPLHLHLRPPEPSSVTLTGPTGQCHPGQVTWGSWQRTVATSAWFGFFFFFFPLFSPLFPSFPFLSPLLLFFLSCFSFFLFLQMPHDYFKAVMLWPHPWALRVVPWFGEFLVAGPVTSLWSLRSHCGGHNHFPVRGSLQALPALLGTEGCYLSFLLFKCHGADKRNYPSYFKQKGVSYGK